MFKSAAVEGAALPPGGPDEDLVSVAGSPARGLCSCYSRPVPQVEEASVVTEDDCLAEPDGAPPTPRNLSAWSVAIPDVHSCQDELKRDKVPVFCIDVERNDRKQGEQPPRGWGWREEIATATS